jgi:N6-adenosine-specific RNA methylase IME4
MNELIKYNNCDFTKNQLVFSETITKEEWEEIGYGLSKINKSVGIWMGDWIRFGDTKGYVNSKVYDEIVRLTGMNRKTLQNYKNVAEKTSELRKSSRRREDIDFSYYAEVAPLSTEKQIEWLDKVEEENLSSKELRNEIRKEKQHFEIQELPTGIYNVVYCDPPWQYSNSGLGGSAESHYPTMSTDEICNMELPELAENSICFMWVTNPLLEDGLKVLKSWGFEYKTNMVWFKEKQTYGLLGFYVYGQHEILLIGVRGSMLPMGEMFSSIIKGANIQHSKKPEITYEIIERMYPGCKYIELFARNKRENWSNWGNEINDK